MASSVQNVPKYPPANASHFAMPGLHDPGQTYRALSKIPVMVLGCCGGGNRSFLQARLGSSQCQVASMQNGAGDCCQKPCGKDCNRRLPIWKMFCAAVNCLDQGPVPVPATFSFSDLKASHAAAGSQACLRPHPIQRPRRAFCGDQRISGCIRKPAHRRPGGGRNLVAFNVFKGTPFSFACWTHYYLTDKVNHGNCA